MRSNAKYIWIIVFITFVGGYLLLETSGLMGRSGVSTSTVVATVNGKDILYLTWANATQQLAQQQEQANTRGLTLDERSQIDEQAYNQLVTDILLEQEYAKRGIRVTDAEIIEAAKQNPPPQFMQAPELQTDGRFDQSKYQRFLASPGAKAQGLLAQLEGYYRTELPKQKLFSQIAGDVFVSDARLWQIWKDTHDSSSISFVAMRPTVDKDMFAAVTDAEIQKYYDQHKSSFDRPGRAVLSIVQVSRRASAADSLATLKRVQTLREEIMKGSKFDDIAKRESDDSVSGAKGGALTPGPRGTYVKVFEDAAFKLKIGEVSPPVPTEFGFHLIKLDARKGDTLTIRHILKLIKQSDSSATITDKRADSLVTLAASQTEPAKFDSAAKQLKMLVSRIEVQEGQPASYLGRNVPSVGAWAFTGARPGESSDLYDDELGYYLVRLDSLTEGGVQPLSALKQDIREAVARLKAIDALLPEAQSLVAAAAGSTLETAATAKKVIVEKAGPFTRTTTVPALGNMSEAVGAAFGVAAGQVTPPIRTNEGVFVIRVDKRTDADQKLWEAQKGLQREQVTRGMREQRVRMFLDNLRKSAKIDDRRKAVQLSQRRVSA